MSAQTAVKQPEEDHQVGRVVANVHSAVAAAHATQVRTPDEAEQAAEVLAQIAREKRRSEDARKELVKPLNDHVKRINQRFKEAAAPLVEADGIVRAKLLTWKQEQERRRHEELRRVEQQRREAEAREAEARQARTQKLAEAADSRRRQIAAMTDDQLAELLLCEPDGEEAEERVRLARDELRDRRTAKENEAKVADARRELQDAPAAAPTTVRSQSGSVSTRKVWKAEIVDDQAVPREYLTVDTRKVHAAVRAGVRDIPGVRIWQDEELAVSAR